MSQSVVNSEERPSSSPITRGVLQALPVVMGYIPIGFAYAKLI